MLIQTLLFAHLPGFVILNILVYRSVCENPVLPVKLISSWDDNTLVSGPPLPWYHGIFFSGVVEEAEKGPE